MRVWIPQNSTEKSTATHPSPSALFCAAIAAAVAASTAALQQQQQQMQMQMQMQQQAGGSGLQAADLSGAMGGLNVSNVTGPNTELIKELAEEVVRLRKMLEDKKVAQ